ncbi:MAG TPA: DUF4383 domain-containing protein [Tepidisphaeraceae bacterium]|nr:DUF4383 domain-containing protein [Tepidisphaeraceae bacterium]
MFPNGNRLVTFFVGLLLLGLGICGLIHPLLQSPHPEQAEAQHMMVSVNYGFLFGVFAMNIVSDIVFIVLGVAGIVAAYTASISRVYERSLCILSVVFMLMGFMPGEIDKVWGLMPLFGWTDALFFFIALLTFYFGFVEGPPSTFLNQPLEPLSQIEPPNDPLGPKHSTRPPTGLSHS